MSDEEERKLLDAITGLDTEELDEELWITVTDDLKGLRERMIMRAEIKFNERINQILGGR